MEISQSYGGPAAKPYLLSDWKAGQKPPSGWDCANAVEDGWTDAELTAFMKATVKPYGAFSEIRKGDAFAEDRPSLPAGPSDPATLNEPIGEPQRRKERGAADRLAARIKETVSGLLGPAVAVSVDADIIAEMIDGAFWSGARSRLYLLTPDEALVQFVQADAAKFLRRRFGSPVDMDAIIKAAPTSPTPEEEAKLRKALADAVFGPILDHLKYANQRDTVEWRVDMFADRPHIALTGEAVRITLTHQPLPSMGDADRDVIDDYRKHFPQLDEVIEYMVAGRFALDRKKSYLWLLAESDWGKGFFLGALNDLGLVVEMSVKEIEAVFEGKPAGRRPEDFKRSFVLAVDEFKSVKSELKQLQSELALTPKFQLTASVEIFTKLFLSAESVAALVTEHGVEDQFANRMSLITGEGTLNARPKYAEDQGHYFRSVRAYVASEMNRLISSYQALGMHGAERRADAYLGDFIARHGIGTRVERLSSNYGKIAADAVKWIRNSKPAFIVSGDGGAEYLTNPNRALEDYLSEHFTHSERGVLSKRKPEIMKAMSADGRGCGAHRIGSDVRKVVKLSGFAMEGDRSQFFDDW